MKKISISRTTGGAEPERGEVERSETERSAGAAPPQRSDRAAGDTEVLERAQRRSFPASYKLKIVSEADRLSGSGEIGAMLRREGIYSSQLAKWRKLRDDGALTGLSGNKRGPKPVETGPVLKEVQRLKRENERLQKKLRKAEMLIEIQKKVAALLEEDERNGSA